MARVKTKKDMARVITKALLNLPTLPNENHWKVMQLTGWKREDLMKFHDHAQRILSNKIYQMYQKIT